MSTIITSSPCFCRISLLYLVWFTSMTVGETARGQRIEDGLKLLYDLDECSGTTIHDRSGASAPIDLTAIFGHLGNQVSWIPGGMSVSGTTVIASDAGAASDLVQALVDGTGFTIETWIRPARDSLQAPIIDNGVGNRSNFNLGQSNIYYGGYNGGQFFQGGFVDSGTLQHVVYTSSKDTGMQNVYVNNSLELSVGGGEPTLRFHDRDLPLAIAGRPETGRAWQGEIYMIAIYDHALSFAEVDQNFQSGANPNFVIPNPLPPFLNAGDSNQDLAFDQFDIIQVSQFGKYLTGQSASWGEGDWNGVKGSACFVGNPPVGDGLFDQRDIVAALDGGLYLTGPYMALNGSGRIGDEQTSIVYNVTTGEISVDAPATSELTSINIDSTASIFTGESAMNLSGSFDNDTANNLFKATFGSSFGSFSFGRVAQPGLSKEFVASDLSVIGSLAGGGNLGDVDVVYVPEPSAFLLLALGAIAATRLAVPPRTG